MTNFVRVLKMINNNIQEIGSIKWSSGIELDRMTKAMLYDMDYKQTDIMIDLTDNIGSTCCVPGILFIFVQLPGLNK